VFGKEEPAQTLAGYLESEVRLVSERTRGVNDADKPRVLLFGLNPNVRRSGGSGTAARDPSGSDAKPPEPKLK
jgi:iron complex transport system substrate-binding protein